MYANDSHSGYDDDFSAFPFNGSDEDAEYDYHPSDVEEDSDSNVHPKISSDIRVVGYVYM